VWVRPRPQRRTQTVHVVAELAIRLEDVVRFELSEWAGAESLSSRLRARWLEWIEKPEDGWVVAAELRLELGDLSLLLRAVESWLIERGLRGLRFELDGRSYLLRAPETAFTGVAA
jgi:hypothetical protein